MSDLAGLNDVTDHTPPRVTIGGSRVGNLHPCSSPATEAKNPRFETRFHVLMTVVQFRIEMLSDSTPPGRLRRPIDCSIAKLVWRTTKKIPKPPQSSSLDGLEYPCDTVAASADHPI
ncbi:unnamed protein product [Dibothriocephalus latus]|uniref:Uncharacterized protein n=1 Tax=Dibothriocephalus latus TaxID=60516 RepID=A0A3P6TAQ5_DIBLA|nr:unnamed protein product [Dibothriocephalus latus]